MRDFHLQAPLPPLFLHRSEAYPCHYLPGRPARSQLAVPPQWITQKAFDTLLRQGFRRSGELVYRPVCDECAACVPVRLPVARFCANRSQQRCLKKHATLSARERPLRFFAEHYQLYRRYQLARHPGGGMDEDDQEHYANSLLHSRIDTRLVEFSENGTLRMVCVIDVVADGLSSVYSFFDPAVENAAYGTYGILWQIGQCATSKLDHLYLGYWIEGCRKMSYKSRFRPIEGLLQGSWRELGPAG